MSSLLAYGDAFRNVIFVVGRQGLGIAGDGFHGETMQLRALMSAANSSMAWDLRCLVREKLIEFLQTKYPDSLPRTRAELSGIPKVQMSEERERKAP